MGKTGNYPLTYSSEQKRQGEEETDPKAILASTFAIAAGITPFFPTFPPAKLLFDTVKLPQTAVAIWGLPLSTIIALVTNGSLWLLMAAAVYGTVCFIRSPPPLPPMPEAPHLAAPPLEDPLVSTEATHIPPAMTITPTTIMPTPFLPVTSAPDTMPNPGPFSKPRRRRSQILFRAVLVPVRLSRKSIEAEMDIQTIEGIGPVYGAILRNSGIYTVNRC